MSPFKLVSHHIVERRLGPGTDAGRCCHHWVRPNHNGHSSNIHNNNGRYRKSDNPPCQYPLLLLRVMQHHRTLRAFVPILSLACIFSSAVCHPSHSPPVPTPVLPYAGDATPSHAHRYIIRCQLFHCSLLSLVFLSLPHNHYVTRSTSSFLYAPYRHSCARNNRSRISIMYPVLPRHSCIHHTPHLCPGLSLPHNRYAPPFYSSFMDAPYF